MLLAGGFALLVVTISWMNIRHLAAKKRHIEFEANLGWKGLHIRVKIR